MRTSIDLSEFININLRAIGMEIIAKGCEKHRQYRGKAAPRKKCSACEMIYKCAVEQNLWNKGESKHEGSK